MNQKQREFLIEHIKKQHSTAVDRLKREKPQAPSLNNYLIASILDGSFRLLAGDEIRNHIRELALSLGPNDALIASERHYGRGNVLDRDDAEIRIAVTSLFEMPPAYAVAKAEYEAHLAEWQSRYDRAEEIKDTLILKIQLGSNESLGKLIDQADNLADLQLMSSRLLLTEATEQ